MVVVDVVLVVEDVAIVVVVVVIVVVVVAIVVVVVVIAAVVVAIVVQIGVVLTNYPSGPDIRFEVLFRRWGVVVVAVVLSHMVLHAKGLGYILAYGVASLNVVLLLGVHARSVCRYLEVAPSPCLLLTSELSVRRRQLQQPRCRQLLALSQCLSPPIEAFVERSVLWLAWRLSLYPPLTTSACRLCLAARF
jgi:hypothetical protein